MTRTVVLAANTSWYLYKFRKSTIKAFLQEHYRVVCIAPRDQYSESLQELGADYVPLDFDQAGTNILKEILLAMRVWLLLRRLKPDYVFNFTIKLNIYSGVACSLLGIDYANNVSGLGTTFLSEGVVFSLAKRLYALGNRRARAVFFQNPEDLNLFSSRRLVRPDVARLLPGSGIDLEHFAFRAMPIEPVPFTFIMVARLIADKGIREFIEAAGRVRAMFPETRFLAVGSTGARNRSVVHEDEIAEWKSQGIVEFPGEQEDIRPWLEQSHVLVLPSYREGMPRVVLEAAAVGRPAIVSDVAGCRHSISPGETGWMCRVRDVQDLVRAMLEVLEMPLARIASTGVNARSRVEREFSERIVVNAYLECLTEGKYEGEKE